MKIFKISFVSFLVVGFSVLGLAREMVPGMDHQYEVIFLANTNSRPYIIAGNNISQMEDSCRGAIAFAVEDGFDSILFYHLGTFDLPKMQREQSEDLGPWIGRVMIQFYQVNSKLTTNPCQNLI